MKISTPHQCVPLPKVVYFQEGPGLRNWQYGTEGVPFLNIRTLKDNGFIDKSLCQFVKEEEFTNKYEHFLLDEGDYVVSSSGTLGKLAEVRKQDLPVMLNTSVIRFRPLDASILDKTFLKWFIKSSLYLTQIQRASTGTAIKNYGPSHLKKMVIPLPPIALQRRIASILDKADEIRRKRQEAIKLTEELGRSLFLDMFGDPVTNPKGWEIRKLEKITNKITDGTHKTPQYLENGIPFLSAKNIRKHKIDWENTRFISRNEHEQLIKRCNPEMGDIMLTKSGSIGDAVLIDKELDFSLFESVALIKLNKEVINPFFLSFLLNEPSIKFFYKRNTKGVTIKHLHIIDIKRIPVIIPLLKKQNEFLLKIQKIKEQENLSRISCIESENLFNSLLQRAFKGEL